MQAWAVTISAALQRGVPWPQLREKFAGTMFEPRDHRYTSLVDAVALHVDELVEQLRTQQQKIVLPIEWKEVVPQPPRQDDASLSVE